MLKSLYANPGENTESIKSLEKMLGVTGRSAVMAKLSSANQSPQGTSDLLSAIKGKVGSSGWSELQAGKQSWVTAANIITKSQGVSAGWVTEMAFGTAGRLPDEKLYIDKEKELIKVFMGKESNPNDIIENYKDFNKALRDVSSGKTQEELIAGSQSKKYTDYVQQIFDRESQSPGTIKKAAGLWGDLSGLEKTRSGLPGASAPGTYAARTRSVGRGEGYLRTALYGAGEQIREFGKHPLTYVADLPANAMLAIASTTQRAVSSLFDPQTWTPDPNYTKTISDPYAKGSASVGSAQDQKWLGNVESEITGGGKSVAQSPDKSLGALIRSADTLARKFDQVAGAVSRSGGKSMWSSSFSEKVLEDRKP